MSRAHKSLRVVLMSVCAACAPASSLARQEPTKPIADTRIAVVRADGAIIPFAEYRKGRWTSIWTGLERRGHSLPITLDDVDDDWWGSAGPALRWSLWQKPGDATPLDVTALRPVATPCSTEAALETPFSVEGAPPPADAVPFPKAGLASTTPIVYEPIVPVSRSSAEWARVKEAVVREFDGREDQALVEMAWRHPTRARERRTVPIDLQAVWHVPGGRFFYFEAMRRYPEKKTPRGEKPCDLVTYVAGYFWLDERGTLRAEQVGALVSYCHLERAMFMWPLGEMRDGVRRFWVMQSAGWTGEAYAVQEMLPDSGDIRQQVWHIAGQCELR